MNLFSFFSILCISTVFNCNIFPDKGYTYSFPLDSLEHANKVSIETPPSEIEKVPELKWYSMITNVPGDWVSFGKKYADKET